jgi:hypothetical protein
MADKTFIKITNADVYEKLISIDHKIDQMKGTVSWHTKAIAAIIIILVTIIRALI